MSEGRFIKDALLVYDTSKRHLQLSDDQIIVVGRSMGCGPATLLAGLRPCAALILVSPFTSLFDASIDKVGSAVGKMFVTDMFRNIDNIRKVRAPVFITHGLLDNVISWKHS